MINTDDRLPVASLLGNSIWVQDKLDINILVKENFGKGILSRSYQSSDITSYVVGSHNQQEKGFTVIEPLQLSYEETFYLLSENSIIVKQDQMICTIEELFNLFCKLQHDFVITSYVYRYYKSLNWIPKSGLKYGAHFLLYRLGPKLDHARYCCIITKCYDNDNENKDITESNPSLSWLDVITAVRVSESTVKELLLIQVIFPSRDFPINLNIYNHLKLNSIVINRFPHVKRENSQLEKKKEENND